MVKKFFKAIWFLIKLFQQTILTITSLLILFFIIAIFSIYSNLTKINKTAPVITNQGALVIKLNGNLVDKTNDELLSDLLEMTLGNDSKNISTFDLVDVIKQATDDDKVKGIVLDLNNFASGDLSSIKYVGKALNAFKHSGKQVIAYSDNYSQGQYILSSYANEIVLNPFGETEITGLSFQNIYYHKLLENLKVSPHVFKVGTYKSAVEPILRDNMSPEAKENAQQLLDQTWDSFLQIIAENRKIDKSSILYKADDYLNALQKYQGNATQISLQSKLVDKLMTAQQLEKYLIDKYGYNNSQKSYQKIKYNDYLASIKKSTSNSPKIAAISIEGEIVSEDQSNGQEKVAASDDIVKLIRKANLDKNVKGVVLRINSPGGSAFASEMIRQEIESLIKNKPVVVSMGGLTASGGYWIASTSDQIIADADTLTGSIGIFGVLFTFENSLKTIGVNTDQVSSSELAGLSITKELDPKISKIMQLKIENGYDKFISLVSEKRNIEKDKVDSIAQGRVWTGRDALKYKLVDLLGDFDLAVDKVKQLIKEKNNSEDPTNLAVEWLMPENNLLNGFFNSQENTLTNTAFKYVMGNNFNQIKEIKQKINLNKFTDPKGIYMYCLNCGKIQ